MYSNHENLHRSFRFVEFWESVDQDKIFSSTMNTTDVPLMRTYDGHTIQPLGQVQLEIVHDTHHHNLQVCVVPGTRPNLLECDWLAVLILNRTTVQHVDSVKGQADLWSCFQNCLVGHRYNE